MTSRSPYMTIICLIYLNLDLVGNSILFALDPYSPKS